MAAVTVTVRKYDYKTMTLVQSGSFTYTPSSTKYTFGVRGITFDGANLLFSTTRSTGSAAQAPQLLTVDAKTFTLLDAQTISGLSTTRDCLDIAWCRSREEGGAHMVAVVDISATRELWSLATSGPKLTRGAKVLNGGIAAYSRGIAWDGSHAWVTSPSTSPGTCVLYQYDVPAGTQFKSFTMNSAGFVGGGIMWDGVHLFEKYDPTLNFSRSYNLYVVSPTALTATKFFSGAADNATEQGPIAFDGAYIYEFDSSL